MIRKNKELLDFTWKLNHINYLDFTLTKLLKEFKEFKEKKSLTKSRENDIDLELITKNTNDRYKIISSPFHSPKKNNQNYTNNHHYINSNTHLSIIPSNQPTNLVLNSNLCLSGIPSNINANNVEVDKAFLYTGKSYLIKEILY